jgi:hypothetical protein
MDHGAADSGSAGRRTSIRSSATTERGTLAAHAMHAPQKSQYIHGEKLFVSRAIMAARGKRRAFKLIGGQFLRPSDQSQNYPRLLHAMPPRPANPSLRAAR